MGIVDDGLLMVRNTMQMRIVIRNMDAEQERVTLQYIFVYFADRIPIKYEPSFCQKKWLQLSQVFSTQMQ